MQPGNAGGSLGMAAPLALSRRENSTAYLRLSLSVTRRLIGDKPELLDRFVKGSPRLGPLGLCDRPFAHPPELFDRLDGPKRAGPRYADGPAAYEDIDRIRVELRKMSEGDPGTPVELNIQIPIVRLAVRRNLFRRDRHAIDHNLDEASSARDNFLRARTVQSDRVADEPIAVRRHNHALSDGSGQLRRKCDD